MSIRTHYLENQRICILELLGNFNVDMSNQCLSLVQELPASVTRICIDMAGITEIDASLFSTLLILHQEHPLPDGIHVIFCSRQIARALSLSGVDRLVSVRVDEKLTMDTDTIPYGLNSSDST